MNVKQLNAILLPLTGDVQVKVVDCDNVRSLDSTSHIDNSQYIVAKNGDASILYLVTHHPHFTPRCDSVAWRVP